MKKILFSFLFGTILFAASSVKAITVGDMAVFSIESSYDTNQRSQVLASLQKISSNAYFYIDNNWWKSLDFGQQSEVFKNLDKLAGEFDSRIYPILTQTYGQEWSPGIDNDSRVTILIHQMKDDARGYFNSADEYLKSQISTSNEREMIYLNANIVNDPGTKNYLAHEFVHLITFYQKEKKYNVIEETWLAEARAEYASTILGYDNDYETSNIKVRIKNFMDSKFDSLTEWRGQVFDYGVLNLFTQYLVDQYGVKILADSLNSASTGIISVNYALLKNGFSEDFSNIFTDWTIAIYLNDCSVNLKYCYKNQNLKNFRVTPITNFLPLTGPTTLSTTNRTKDWAGNWIKFAGGRGTLNVEFNSGATSRFKIPYIIEEIGSKPRIEFLNLNNLGQGKISLYDLGFKTLSVTFIPSSQMKNSDFNESEPFYSFSWVVSTTGVEENPTPIPSLTPIPNPNIEQLLLQIDALKKEIVRLQVLLANIQKPSSNNQVSCKTFNSDLYLGLKNDEVRCLQEFLRAQGVNIYPEGIISGGFFNMTFEAVKRYQSKKGIVQTGYFGTTTRQVANQDLTIK